MAIVIYCIFISYLGQHQTLFEAVNWDIELFAYYAATAAAKSLQSCPTLRPHRRQPTRLPRPWDSPGNNTGVGCHFLLQCMKVKSESKVVQSCPTLSNHMDRNLPGSSSMGFSRQEYWSGVPLPSPTIYTICYIRTKCSWLVLMEVNFQNFCCLVAKLYPTVLQPRGL